MPNLTTTEPYKDNSIKYELIGEDYSNEYYNDQCAMCSNNPKNGGSGICLCVLASRSIRW